MTSPSDSGSGSASGSGDGQGSSDGQDSAAGRHHVEEPAFDPYRFGRPDHPVPPEFAPPGYVPDPAPAAGGPTGYPPGPPQGSGQQPYSPSSTPYPYDRPPYGQNPSGQAPYGQVPYGQAPQGQNPYGQAPYGAPPPPYGYGSAQGGNGKAVTAMVLGIASILLCWLSVLAAAVIIPAIVFGFLGLSQARQRGGVGKGMAIAGLACAAVATVLAVIVTVLVTNAIAECGGTANQDDPGFNQCVQEHII